MAKAKKGPKFAAMKKIDSSKAIKRCVFFFLISIPKIWFFYYAFGFALISFLEILLNSATKKRF